MINRRIALATVASLAVPLPVSAQQASVMKLMEPGPLPEKSFGPADAKVTVIEYASVTCHHCMNFHTETWPKLKEKYVDTGKIRFIMREFPLDTLATAGFMLARCAGDDRWYPMLDLLYRSQEAWAHAKNPA
ncbi:MAG TPA: thioredoxin domain-containing protein, partial [Accumulibacter sp.]|nr:thioredoxin domain-containing protein [Accumulibacter sp.]